jgi:predicted nucleic acid-binding protein
MPNGCFIDTNILLYAKDPKATDKRARALAWLDALAERDLAIISPQVMNEFTHNILRKFPHVGHAELVDNLEAMRPWCLAVMNADTALEGLAIHRRYRFSFYDSALVATALGYGCDLFLSENLSHGQKLIDLRVVNPFEIEPRAALNVN